ncbi:MAG: hypothetical protein DMG04_26985 [Acidobacteria bacterium]|nr:MAG: hypothetical protein DMG04_26985 [Acidobacteriota bacterium]
MPTFSLIVNGVGRDVDAGAQSARRNPVRLKAPSRGVCRPRCSARWILRPLCHRKNSPSVIAVDDLPSAGMCHAASIVRSRL